MAETTEIPVPTNRLALVSLLATLLMLFTFCIGVLPIPLTELVCYPASLLFGGIALVTGLVSLRQIRHSRQRGLLLAWTGVGLGAFSLVAALCLLSLTVLLAHWLGGSLPSFLSIPSR